MRFNTLLRGMAAGLALAACDSSTGPQPLEGAYVLLTVEGRPVPAALDSSFWTDGATYTVDRVVARSLEFRDEDVVFYTQVEETVTRFARGDSVVGGRCVSFYAPYRVQGSRLLLVIEPALYGEAGRLRLDTLQIGSGRLVHDVRTRTGRPVRLEYRSSGTPRPCDP